MQQVPNDGAKADARGAPRVMVVDDEPDVAESAATLLRLLGAEVLVAHTGHAALDLFDAFSPDLGLLDLSMPGMDGHETARRIRARAGGADVVLVAVTGWDDESGDTRMRGVFDRYLEKPVSVDEWRALLAAVECRHTECAE